MKTNDSSIVCRCEKCGNTFYVNENNTIIKTKIFDGIQTTSKFYKCTLCGFVNFQITYEENLKQ